MKGIGLLAAVLVLCNCQCKGNSEKSYHPQQEEAGASEQDGIVTEIETTSDSSGDNTANSKEEPQKGTAAAETASGESTPKTTGKIDGAARLMAAYPQKIKDISNNTIYFTDGTTMVYDDGKEKDFVTMLDYSDPQDMFFAEYDTQSKVPEYLHDVGRSRSEELFKKLYGSSQSAVQKQLVPVSWFGQKVMFSSSNGAAEQLKKVAQELAQHPELRKYLKSAGTFYWRNVRGANRLSAHSYGMAIDIGVDYSDYWLWKNSGAGELKKITYHNRMPMELVEIFEKYGFVWGGRWYHFDTMHFEYRPELNPPRR